MKYKTKLTFKIYWQHAKRYGLALFFVVSFVLVADVFRVVAPYYYKKFFDALAAQASVEELVSILVAIFGFLIAGLVFKRTALFINSHFQTSVMRDLANTCFEHLHKHSSTFFHNNFVGSLVKRVNRFYRSFERVADKLFLDLLPIVANVTFAVVILSYRNIWLGVIMVVWVMFFCFITYLLTKYKLKYDIERSQLDTKVTGRLADTITNHGNVKLFVGYSREKKAFGSLTEALARLRKFTWNLGNGFDLAQGFLMILLEVGLMYFAVGLWEQGILTLGDFVLIQTYLFYIFARLWDFGRIFRDFYESLADAEEMTEILDTPFEIRDAKRAKKLVVEKGKIEFQNVRFHYHKTRRIIDKLNVTIKPGERIALVGPSGAGKSTIVKLLLRQHDVTGGKILVDGQVVSKVTQESLWENISLVPQDPMLFHRPLIENIRYGKPDATDEEVVAAAKLAHCHEFIQEFPSKYQTYVGERGVKLSGGERQRVAIARAILRNAPILILDEATSSLDSESEMLIQDALDVLMKGKTVLVIAHRLSTIMKMDRILVIDGGDVVEQGTHKQLLKKKHGIYQKLWKLQAGGFVS